MIKYLYRFRPLERLIEKGELINQQIFFAHPDDLNDPMEGFRDIFWRGDKIVWENLFRHYIICLEWAFTIATLGGESLPITWRNIPTSNVTESAFTPQNKKRIRQLTESFINQNSVKEIVELLSLRSTPARREELTTYLQSLHALAVSQIHINHEEHGLSAKTAEISEGNKVPIRLAENGAGIAREVRRIEESGILDADRAISAIFTIQRQMAEELNFINNYKNIDKPFGQNQKFVLIEFPNEYIKMLESLIYPDWYTACFMNECRDSSVWGSYGCNHTAACLVFKGSEDHSTHTLKLKRINGYSTSGPSFGYVSHRFYDIQYENRHKPIDFFGSLGHMTIKELTETWFTSPNGDHSKCQNSVFDDEEVWRTNYWTTFYYGVTRKLDAWRHEKESRLILDGSFHDFSEPASRITEYHFNDLAGIIFGIKTPIDDKIKISKIIEDKCRALNRTDFKFYQAYYDQKNGSIEHREMPFLRFDFASDGNAKTVSQKSI